MNWLLSKMQKQEKNSSIILPQGWASVKLKKIADINPRIKGDSFPEDYEVSFIPMKAVEEESGNYDNSEKRFFGKVKKGYTSFREGDLIFAKITPCMENGKIAILNSLHNGIGYGSTEFHVVRLDQHISKKLIFYYLVQQDFRRLARQNMTGSAGQLRVPKKFIEEADIPLPPLPEQHRIVDKIEELFTQLDKGVEQLKAVQQQLQTYRQAVLKAAFEGRLVEGRKTKVEGQKTQSAQDLLKQIKIERQQHYEQALEQWTAEVEEWEANGKPGKKPRKPKEYPPLTEEELKELPELPEGWVWVKSGNVIDPINNGYTPTKEYLSSGFGEIPFIKVYNLNFDGTFNFKKDPTFIPEEIHKNSLARSITYPDDILINIVGPPLGKVSIVTDQYPQWNINQAIVLFRPNAYVKSKFISYVLQNPKTIYWLEGTSKATAGQYNVKVSTCREIPFPLCPIAEQNQIVQEIESRLSVCEQVEKTIEANLQKAEALRQSILKKAFEGKLVPQDPEDEPAGVLLERIKAARREKIG